MPRANKVMDLSVKTDRNHCHSPLRAPVDSNADELTINDYFVEKDGHRFAGIHLLIDLIDARHLNDTVIIEQAMRDAAEAAGASPLHCHLHHYSENGGVSGVLLLAESHISIHTWPERDFAAVDIFTCGQCDPHAAIDVFHRAFAPGSAQVSEQKRGLLF